MTQPAAFEASLFVAFPDVITQTVEAVLASGLDVHLVFHLFPVSHYLDLCEVSVIEIEVFFASCILLDMLGCMFRIFVRAKIWFGHDIFFDLENLALDHRRVGLIV